MYVAKRIVPALAAVVNMCLSSGIFPDKLKITRTETLFIQVLGNTDAPKSCRLSSLILIVAKLFEAVIKVQLKLF